MKAKKPSVFPSIRTVAGIPDQEIEDSIYRLHETQLQLRRLANTYYGDTASFLPYMYRIEHGQAGRHEPAWNQQYYVFDPDACDTFIREMTYYYDLAFWRSYQIDPSDTLIDFIQSFLYLAIRIACPDERLFPYFDYGSYGDEIYGLLNNGTFLDIINLSRLSNISRSFFADSSYMLSFSVLCSCVCSRLISPSVSSWHKQDNTLMHQSPGHIQRRTPYNF